MSKQTKANKPAAPLLACVGQFLAVSEKAVTVHLLNAGQLAAFYDCDSIAATAVNPVRARQQMLRETFRDADIVFALPAFNAATLLHYVDHYEGPQRDAVRGICACILTGKPFGPADGPEDTDNGGSHDRLPQPPKGPKGGSGAALPGTDFAALMTG